MRDFEPVSLMMVAGDLLDGELVRIADVDRGVDLRFEQQGDAPHQVRHIAKAAGLRALAVDRQRTALERLGDEVGHSNRFNM